MKRGSLCSHPPEYSAHPETSALCWERVLDVLSTQSKQQDGSSSSEDRRKKKTGGGAASSLNSLSPQMPESQALTGLVCSSGRPSGANFAPHPKPWGGRRGIVGWFDRHAAAEIVQCSN